MGGWVILLTIYGILTVFFGIAFAITWLKDEPDGDFNLLWLPNIIVSEYVEDAGINKVGQFILDILMNLLFAPATLFAMIIVALAIIPIVFVFCFEWLFRKRKKK